MATRQQFIDAATAYHGTRWRHEGRDKNGIDCAGLIIVAGKEVGVLAQDFDVQGYVRQSDTFDFAGYFTRIMSRKRYVDRRPGDVLLFRTGLSPCHCAVLFDRPGRGETLIHALAPRRRVTYDPLHGPWEKIAFSYCYEFEFED